MLTIGVAIAIPEPFGPELRRWRGFFGDPLASAIPPHITLLPPTEIDEADCDAIEAHLDAAARKHRPFSIRLRGTATFRPVSRVVFIALAHGIGQCEQLERSIRSGPLDRELYFPYHPHVTVAHDLDDALLDQAFEKLGDYDASFLARGFSLYTHDPDDVWRRHRDYSFPAMD